jgi:hypothetical protein
MLKMSNETKTPGNILVDPAEYASRLKNLDQDRDGSDIERLENHLAHRLRLGGSITYIDENNVHVIEDQSGIYPFPVGSEFPTSPESAELEIRELAFLNGIHGDKTEFDEWCESVSANAGDDIQSDEVELLLIGLGRLDTLDGVKLTRLHNRYLEELLNK